MRNSTPHLQPGRQAAIYDYSLFPSSKKGSDPISCCNVYSICFGFLEQSLIGHNVKGFSEVQVDSINWTTIVERFSPYLNHHQELCHI